VSESVVEGGESLPVAGCECFRKRVSHRDAPPAFTFKEA
jgi:hypothetical protein